MSNDELMMANVTQFPSIDEYYGSKEVVDVFLVYFCVIDILMILPTVIGNSLIIISVIRFKRLRTRMHALVVNLAVADLLVGVVVIPMELTILFGKGYYKMKYMCLTWHCFGVAFCLASVINLFLISMDRYTAIIHPLSYKKKNGNVSRLAAIISMSWVLSLSTGFMPLMGVNKWQPGMPCDTDFVYFKGYRGFIYILLLGFVVSNLVMYITVVKTAIHQIRRIEVELHHDVSEQVRQLRSSKDHLHKTKIMFLVFGVFALCWGPFCIAIIINIFILPGSKQMVIVRKFLSYIGMFNSSLNWIIYGVKNRDFRTAFKVILMCAPASKGGNLEEPSVTSSARLSSLSSE